MPPAQNKTPSAPTLLAVVCVACCALAVQQASCRRVHRCFLARKLREAGFDRYHILHFLCVANMVSKFNMTMQVKREGGQRTVGIFQLASQFFCFDNYKPGMRNGRCHELCDAFLDENLEDDIRCAALVRHLWGFKYWTGWEQKCLYGKVSPFLEGCDYEN
ncbi:lysozyme C-1-like isoform X5 [Dermacentor variabilis]|uniref:lysozyme C-1-like isoform X5 n=1 Tax=Dermacentor variabilis TaxID=34621 RepID=UPI003F5C7AF9